MRNCAKAWRGAALGLFLLVGWAAPGAAQVWNQAYGNGNNTSFLAVQDTGWLHAAWRFPLAGPAAWAGPAVAQDGTVWAGTTNGVLHAINPDGTERCAATFAGGSISSTPAILKDGRAAVLVHLPDRVDPSFQQTSLALVAPTCEVLWQRDLPRMQFDHPSTATGSVKLWTSARGTTFLFVHGYYTNVEFFIDDADRNAFNSLLVYGEDGTEFAHQPVSRNCIVLHGGGLLQGIVPSEGRTPSRGPKPKKAAPLYTTLGWPGSTPAVVTARIPGLSDPNEPMIAVTDDWCEARLETFRFRPDATGLQSRLFRTSTKEVAERHTRLSSPAVTDAGVAYFGGSDCVLRAWDLTGGGCQWTRNLEGAVMHPPAVSASFLFATTDDKGWILTPEGDLVPTGRPQPWPLESKVGAGAASQLQAVIGHFKEVTYLSPDLYSVGHALTHDHFRSTNPALTASGRVYVITQTSEKGSELVALGDVP